MVTRFDFFRRGVFTEHGLLDGSSFPMARASEAVPERELPSAMTDAMQGPRPLE